jgi:hypothetical protein
MTPKSLETISFNKKTHEFWQPGQKYLRDITEVVACFFMSLQQLHLKRRKNTKIVATPRLNSSFSNFKLWMSNEEFELIKCFNILELCGFVNYTGLRARRFEDLIIENITPCLDCATFYGTKVNVPQSLSYDYKLVQCIPECISDGYETEFFACVWSSSCALWGELHRSLCTADFPDTQVERNM